MILAGEFSQRLLVLVIFNIVWLIFSKTDHGKLFV